MILFILSLTQIVFLFQWNKNLTILNFLKDESFIDKQVNELILLGKTNIISPFFTNGIKVYVYVFLKTMAQGIYTYILESSTIKENIEYLSDALLDNLFNLPLKDLFEWGCCTKVFY